MTVSLPSASESIVTEESDSRIESQESRSTSIRVLFIVFDSAELSIRLASALSNHVDVCLMLPKNEAKPHLKWLDSKVDFQPFTKWRLRQPLRQLRLMLQLIRRIRAVNPDVIHFQKGHLYFNLILPFLQRYPLVVSIHDPRCHMGDAGGKKTPQAIMDLAYRRAHHAIVHNDPMKQIVIDELKIPGEMISVVPLIERGDDELRPDVSEAGAEILFYGRIWAYKGLEYLIRAEPLIAERVPDVRIIIAGMGDDFSPYRNMMVHPDRFLVHNEFVSYEKQAELFRRASIVVLPYVEATQSGVIPVAYTYSKPVVATRVGGLPAQVDDDRTGLLVPPCDERALADAVIRLLLDDEYRRRLGANGRRKVDEEWSADVIAQQTIPAYEKAIAAARIRRS